MPQFFGAAGREMVPRDDSIESIVTDGRLQEVVWQKAHVMALDVERVAGGIRGARHAALRNQIIRAADSVPANIVEGSAEQTAANFSRFLRIALNSTTELEYHLILAGDRKVISGADSLTLRTQAIEVRKMLYGLRRHLASRSERDKEVR